ncbi:MAG: ferrous iron transport protein B [Candidatus Krumholzibacteria bacterium]|nr:ferrous iron transport protein B [Candidatus Krumholzibacteria bacterium]
MPDNAKIALAGNPNAGKTTLFNRLTGARQHVGNYPGVTVEKKQGVCRWGDHELHIVDLPGIYGLTPHSDEEVVARNYLFFEKPDAVIAVIDASNLERNLYLAIQLKELGVPLVLCFNMIDVAKSRGYEIDIRKLSRRLGARIIPTVGHKEFGINELLETTVAVAQGENGLRDVPVNYGRDIENAIGGVSELLAKQDGRYSDIQRRWIALKLLERDEEVRSKIKLPQVLELADKNADRIEELYNESPEIVIAEGRYNLIAAVCRDAVKGPPLERRTKTDRIDSVVAHRILGIPIFLGLMYLIFELTFTIGAPAMDLIEAGFSRLGDFVNSFWAPGAQSYLRSLLVDGIIGGVGGVIVFLPNILLLFLAISLLESSGYMARAAFIMDRVMNKIGLHGKSFIPMLIGFGCSVPAIMATRTLDNRRDRLVTMFVIPLISCSARLPIYLLIIPAFFPSKWNAPMLWLIYVIGIALAVLSAKLLRTTVFKGETSPFLMELPPYKVPTMKGALFQMWERARLFLRKAGTMILGVSIVLWALSSFPRLDAERLDPDPSVAARQQMDHSVAGKIGQAMEPVIGLMGFDWKIGTALIGAFAAKEVFVAQMGIVYSLGDVDEESGTLRDKLRQAYTPLIAFCIMLFALISSPCMATVAITRRESNSWKWAIFQLIGLTVLAFVLTVLVYQIGVRIIS